MNKTAIKNFAIWARNKLIKEITYKAGLVGVTEKGIADALPQSTKDIQWFDIGTSEPSSIQGEAIKQREKLVQRIREKEKDSDYKIAYTSIIEEVAYTWFNRLIAIRFMEVNDYLPSRVRVLSSETVGKEEPDLVTTPFESDLEFTSTEVDLIMQYKDTNQLDELFRMLFIKQCNKLNEILPELFEKTADYTELLLNISYTDKDGVVYHLTHDIDAEDFCVRENEEGQVTGQIEIIGWLYQYYNTELKAKADLDVKSGIKISKYNLPEKTQVFTPDWVVRYMVENSLGRLWLEGHPNDDLKSNWKYYLDEMEQEETVKIDLEKLTVEYKRNTPEDIKLIDPCMGSGHILVYAFDVLMKIYKSLGHTQRDAVKFILEKNIYGLDIDERAYQLAYFALMMKARQYDRRFLTRGIAPQVYCPKGDIEGAEYGSLLNVDTLESKPHEPEELTIFNLDWEKDLNTWNFRRLLNQKYDVVVTNPPYLGLRNIGTKTLAYIQDNYPDSKNDLFSVFIDKSIRLAKKNGKIGLVTAESWLSLSSFEKIRQRALQETTIINMIHLGEDAFDAGFGTVAFVLSMTYVKNYIGTYYRLAKFKNNEEKEKAVLRKEKGSFYLAKQDDFSNIPGNAISYWVSQDLFSTFNQFKPLGEIAEPRQGLTTCDNDRFMRYWHEVNISNICFNCLSTDESLELPQKWFPYNKGGEPRKWYGNNDYIVNWQYDGREVKSFVASKYVSYTRTVKNIPYYFREGLTWSAIAKKYAVRAYNKGFIFADKGQAIFADDEQYYYLCGLLNSKFTEAILAIISPTLDFNCGYIKKIPICIDESVKNSVERFVKENIEITKCDWDSFETSWDFVKHPLITNKSGVGYVDVPIEQWKYRIADAFKSWESNAEEQFSTLKDNEEELNRIFIDIYGLQDELTPEVEEKDVTVRKANLTRDIKSFVSYAVGCMFGRYSLDREGLTYAGGDWDESKYTSFIPDIDNIIVITEDEYFTDDIVNRFVEFVKVVYGDETLEENLDFIANALGNKGNTSREVIRNYFIKDFYKDHCKTYQKRPIYWLFDSGKQNGFKALIYMHRYNADTIGNLRIDYLHRLQKVYESEIVRMQDIVDNSNNAKESTAAAKRRDKLVKQLKETKDYDQKIAHLALARTEIELDDGVKVNYEKVQTGADGKKLQVLAKI